MRVLLLAPQPFYVERGTPIAVRLVATALLRAGHTVDLVCFHEGRDLALPGLQLHRVVVPRWVRNVPIGLSWQKLLCDLALFRSASRLLRRERFDVLHAVEEAIFIALLLRRRHPVRVIYDMDSLMSAQLAQSSRIWRVTQWPLRALESWAIRRADRVLAVCSALADAAVAAGAARVDLLPDIALPLPFDDGPPAQPADDLRALFATPAPLLLYVGNLERYQGLDLLLDSVADSRLRGGCNLAVVGGADAVIAHYEARAARLGLAGRVRFIGPRPLSLLPPLLAQADILCSPRLAGVNTPMKIYSYMAAGRAIVATDIVAHTQVLDRDCAELAAPQPRAFAAALRALLDDEKRRHQLGARACELATRLYGFGAYEARLRHAYEGVNAGVGYSDRPLRGYSLDERSQSSGSG